MFDFLKREKSFPKESLADYFIAEMEGLHQRALHFDDAIANRISTYLNITTAIFGVIVFLTQLTNNNWSIVMFALVISLIVVLVIGILTLRQVSEAYGAAVVLYRRVGRIRKWFADHAPEIEPYQPFTVGDDRPKITESKSIPNGINTILIPANLLVFVALSVTLAGIILNVTKSTAPITSGQQYFS